MSIVSFWSSRKRETNQSTSAIISALQMGLERNLKILLVDTSFSDNTYINAFNKREDDDFVKNLNRGKIDISSGVEGLILAVTSNKSTPEIIKNYTSPLLNQERCDILYPMKTKSLDTYKAGFANYPEIIEIANKYYDIVYVDLPKGYGDKATTKILAMSDLIVTTFDQDMELINDFEKLWGKDPLFSPKERVIPLLTKEDRFSAQYNNENVARMIRMTPGMPSILYSTQLMEAGQNGIVGTFLMGNNMYQSARSRNLKFMEALTDLNLLIIDRLQQQKYKGAFNKTNVEDTIKNHIMYMSKEKKTSQDKLTEEEKAQNQNIEKEIINSNKTGLIENKETEAQINKDINKNKQTVSHEENSFTNEMEKVEEKKEDLGTGIKKFFKNIFDPGKKEEKPKDQNELNTENLESVSNIENNNLNNSQNPINNENANQTVNKNETEDKQVLNDDKNTNTNDLDEMSREAAKNITQNINETREVDSAISEAEKIMLENKELLEQLKKASESKKENEKSNLDFSNVEPLNKQETDQSKLYNVDDDGTINYDAENNLMDESVKKVQEHEGEKHQIDFTKIRPLSEEKDEIAKQKYEEIQKEIKAKLMNSNGEENRVVTQTEKLKEEEEEKAQEEKVKKENLEEIKEEVKEKEESTQNIVTEKKESPVFNPILGFGGDDDNEEKDTQEEETIDDLI